MTCRSYCPLSPSLVATLDKIGRILFCIVAHCNLQKEVSFLVEFLNLGG